MVTLFLSPSTSADSQRGPFVLALSTVCRRDESLAELNRHTCVTPGYRPRSLWSPFLTDGAFCFPRTLCVRWGPPPRKKKYTRSPVGQWIGCSRLSASADVANCLTLGREFPAITGRETRWGWMARRGECLGSKQREAPMCGDRLWCL